MVHVLGLLALLAVSLPSVGVTQTPQIRRAAPPPPAKVVFPDGPVRIATDHIGGRPVVQVMVNGKGPYAFMVDTGASGSVVSNTFLEEAGLPVIGEAMVGSPGGTPMPARLSELAVVEFGGIRLEALRATAIDLSRLGPNGPRGVLSLSALPGVLATFSQNPGTLVLERGALPVADGRQIFEWPAAERLPTVPVQIGDKRVMAHVDSGAPAGLKIPKALSEELALTSPLRESGRARMVDREIVMFRAELRDTPTVAGLELPRTVIFEEGTVSANLGVEFLARVHLTIDLTNRRVRLVPR